MRRGAVGDLPDSHGVEDGDAAGWVAAEENLLLEGAARKALRLDANPCNDALFWRALHRRRRARMSLALLDKRVVLSKARALK